MTDVDRLKADVTGKIKILLMWRFLLTCRVYVAIFPDVACLCGEPRQKKKLIPPPRQLLTVNVVQHKRRSLYCTNIYSSVPELSAKILVNPTCSWRNSLDPILHLYPDTQKRKGAAASFVFSWRHPFIHNLNTHTHRQEE